jgi:hypothetical protein
MARKTADPSRLAELDSRLREVTEPRRKLHALARFTLVYDLSASLEY